MSSMPFESSVNLRQLLMRSGVSASIKVAGSLSFVGFNILIARWFGAGGLGLFAMAYAAVIIGATLARLGLDNVIVRYTATREHAGDVERLRKISLCAVGLAGFALGAFFYLLAPWIGTSLLGLPGMAEVLQPLSLAVPLVAVTYLQAQFLRGRNRIASFQFIQGFCIPFAALVLVTITCFIWGLPGSAYAYVLGSVLALLLSLRMWPTQHGERHASHQPEPLRPLFISGLTLLPVALSVIVSQWLPILILGGLTDAEEVGLYQAAQRLASLLGFVLIAVHSVAAPRFAKLYSDGDLIGVVSLARQLSMVMVGLGLLPGLVFICFPSYPLFLFGPTFPTASPILIMLTLGRLISLACGPAGLLCLMAGYDRFYRNAALGGMTLTAVGCALLIPHWGAFGAGLASATGMIVLNLSAAIMIKIKLGFSPVGFGTLVSINSRN